MLPLRSPGQNLGAGKPDRSQRAVHLAARVGLGVAGSIGALFLLIPEQLLGIFGLNDPMVVRLGTELLRLPQPLGPLRSRPHAIQVDCRAPENSQPAGHRPDFAGRRSDGHLLHGAGDGKLRSTTVWSAILAGHFTRCVLSVARFQQGNWRTIAIT